MSKNTLSQLIQATFLVIIALFVFLTFFFPVETEDVWWHISTGEWIVENMQVPDYDIFSYGQTPVAGILPQWLGSVIYFAISSVGGMELLKIFRATFFLLVICIPFIYGRRHLPLTISVLIVLFLVFGLKFRALLRPFVFNFVFIQFFLIILYGFINQKYKKAIWLIPLMALLWVNIHMMGAFIYGNLIIGVFLLACFLQWVNCQYFNQLGDRRVLLGQCKQLLALLLVYIAVFLLNPYGIEGWLYPYRSFLDPQFINFYKLSNLIAELKPPKAAFFYLTNNLWFYLMIFMALFAIGKCKKNQFIHFTLLMCALFMFLNSVRGIAFLSIISCYVIIECFRTIPLKWGRSRLFSSFRIFLLVVLTGWFIVEDIRILNAYVYKDGQYKRRVQVLAHEFNPKPAVDFLMKYNVEGNVFNTAAYGGYLIYSSYPKLRPFADNRQYNQYLYGNYVAVLREPDIFFDRASNDFNFRIAILDSNHMSSLATIEYLKDHPQWVFVYTHGSTIVFLRKDKLHTQEDLVLRYRESVINVPVSPDDLINLKSIGTRVEVSSSKRVIVSPLVFDDRLEKGLTLFDLGYHGAALPFLIEALPQAPESLRLQVVKKVFEVLGSPQDK